MRPPFRGAGRGRLFLLFMAGLLLWLPCLHVFFRPAREDVEASSGVPPLARAMAERQLALWTDPARRVGELERMRRSNAEWDFMGRTFLVLSLANMALREPAEADRYLVAMDILIEDTLRLEKEHGKQYFLMDYARAGGWRSRTPRSLFEDGEIAMMLAARRLLREREDFRPLLAERVAWITAQMQEGPLLCGESYPDECWTFCNTLALAALRMADALDGTDHGALTKRWTEIAREKLVEPATGLLLSSFTWDGRPLDGPEGSSLWMSAHCLQLFDPAWAEDQYRRSRALLGRSLFGFGYAREWPARMEDEMDVDSGPVIPLLGLSAGSSGMALVAAAAFDDQPYLRRLLISLRFGGFPVRRGGEIHFAASNQVGDAAILYALVQGPLWDDVARRYALSTGDTP